MRLGGQKVLIAPPHPHEPSVAAPPFSHYGLEHIGLTIVGSGQGSVCRVVDRLGVDQDEGEDRGLRALGGPGVHRAALHADVARLHRLRAAVVKFELALPLRQIA